MTQMTTDRIYRDQKYYIKYDGAIRACKVVYYKASIDYKFENRYTHAVLNIAGVGNVYFCIQGSYAPTDLPSYIKRDAVRHNSRLPKLYPNKEAKINTELYLCLYSWHTRKAMKERNLINYEHEHDSNYVAVYYKWNGYEVCKKRFTDCNYKCTYDFLSDSFEFDISFEFYGTYESCEADNKVSFVDFEEDDEDFAEQKREEFREYVAHHAPNFEDKIDWEYFMNGKSMPWNLSEQIRVWMS